MPRLDGNGIENGHPDDGMENGGMETWVSGEMGEVETLSLTHPIVRLNRMNSYKSTEGLQSGKHEEVVNVSSECCVCVCV